MASRTAGSLVFKPRNPQALRNLQTATLFTRIGVLGAGGAPACVQYAVTAASELDETFCLAVGAVVLVFGRKEHRYTHRLYLHILWAQLKMDQPGPAGRGVWEEYCIYEAGSAAEARFKIEPVGTDGDAVLVEDLFDPDR